MGIVVKPRSLVHQKSTTMSAAEAEEAPKQPFPLIGPPFDARFPNQNQSRNCWQNYVDFHRCQKLKGEDYANCKYFEFVYKSMCPRSWVEQWDEQREEGKFAGK